MKRIKNLVIGGIQSKVFNLILYTVFLLSAAFLAVSIYQNNNLAQLASESGQRQQEAIGEITGQVMNEVVTLSLAQSNRAEARIVDELFEAAGNRVTFLGDYASKLFADPDAYDPKPYSTPNPADDGTWTAKVIYAKGVDPNAPEIVERVGLLANMSDIMISLCPSFGAANAYIALPEGVHLSVSDTSSSWLVDGAVRDYDPRERGWYKRAVEAGGLVFTDGEYDANTGVYCIECATPVYGPDGSVSAVVGADLYLDEMQTVLLESAVEGEYMLLVNQAGHAVLAPLAETFPMLPQDRVGDLRESQNALLANTINAALAGDETGIALGELADGMYYVIAAPIESTGWVLVSAYSQAISNQPVILLKNSQTAIQEEATATYQNSLARSRTTMRALFVVVVLLTLGGALVLGKRIVGPLNTITHKISELSEGNLEFKMEDAYRTGDEVEELAQSFADLSHKTIVYMDTVRRVTAEKERIGAELNMATAIQASQLPRLFPAFPNRREFDVYASMTPAKEVGGDFYDFFLIDNDHIGLVMADVSGKGVPAALFMMVSRVLIKSHLQNGESPAEALANVNEQLCEGNEAELFVTVWVAVLEISTGEGVAANAGHEHPALRRAGGKYELQIYRHSPAVAMMEGIPFKQHSFKLNPGDSLFVYTDGVAEATDANNELFGNDRMLDALNVDPDANPEAVLSNVMQGINAFVAGAEQFDDITMLCLKYNGPVTPV